jgi:P27 family predicted phage terminase small subunit
MSTQPARQPLRVSTAVMQVSGAFQRNPARAARRIGEIDYPPLDFSRPPAHLDAESVRVWRELASVLEGLEVVSSADSALLTLTAKSISELRRAEKTVEEDGFMVDGGPVSGPKAHPLLSHVRSLRSQVKGLLSEMGWTPVSRSKVTSRVQPEEAAEVNEFEGMLD